MKRKSNAQKMHVAILEIKLFLMKVKYNWLNCIRKMWYLIFRQHHRIKRVVQTYTLVYVCIFAFVVQLYIEDASMCTSSDQRRGHHGNYRNVR